MADTDNDSRLSAQPPPVKRSLFKKIAWAKPTETESDEGIQLFSRSKEIFSNVVAENERKRLERQARLGKTRNKAKVERSAGAAHDGKRRRISNESGSAGSSSDDSVAEPVGQQRYGAHTHCIINMSNVSIEIVDRSHQPVLMEVQSALPQKAAKLPLRHHAPQEPEFRDPTLRSPQ